MARRSHPLNPTSPPSASLSPKPPTMKLSSALLLVAALSSAICSAALTSTYADSTLLPTSTSVAVPPPAAHGHHGHDPHKQPLLVLDEDQVLREHGPDPESYWDHDYASSDKSNTHHGLMAVHVISMIVAFFGALPIGMLVLSCIPITALIDRF